jgi:hypothetical protein
MFNDNAVNQIDTSLNRDIEAYIILFERTEWFFYKKILTFIQAYWFATLQASTISYIF